MSDVVSIAPEPKAVKRLPAKSQPCVVASERLGGTNRRYLVLLSYVFSNRDFTVPAGTCGKQ
jgi:hypothetical protein